MITLIVHLCKEPRGDSDLWLNLALHVFLILIVLLIVLHEIRPARRRRRW